MKKISLLALLIAISLHTFLIAQSDDCKLLPSETHTLMVNAVDVQPDLKRIDATKPYVSRVMTTKLSREEQFYLGEIYFWNFMPKEGYEVYKAFLNGEDDFARAAWQRAMQIDFRAFDKHKKVEADLNNFRKKFKPIPDDRLYMFGQVYNVANKYAEEGNHEKVLQLIDEELNSLNYEGAYSSFQLPAYFAKSYNELGKLDKALQLMQSAKDGLEKTLKEREQKIPETDPDYPTHSSRVIYMATIITDKMSYAEMNNKFEELITKLTGYMEKIKAKRKNN